MSFEHFQRLSQPTETTVDRSFDQTAEHVHANGQLCPTCKLPDCEEPETTVETPTTCPTCKTALTPSGFHLNGIDCETDKLEAIHPAARKQTCGQCGGNWSDSPCGPTHTLIAHVYAFERMAAALAEGIDRVNREYEAKLKEADTSEAVA